MPREVSREQFERDAGSLLDPVSADEETVVVTEAGHPVAVLASYRSITTLAGTVDMPRWGQWLRHMRESFPEAAVRLERMGRPHPGHERVVDKVELGFSPATGVVGSDSGREQLALRLGDLGVPVLDATLLGEVYAAVLELCDAKETVYAEDLRAVAQEMIAEAPQRLRLLAVTVTSTTGLPATAEVTLSLGQGPAMRREQGDGPLDAAIRAIERLTGLAPTVLNFSVFSATPGHDAMAEAVIELELEGTEVVGSGASTNAVEAGIHAYINALNFLVETRGRP